MPSNETGWVHYPGADSDVLRGPATTRPAGSVDEFAPERRAVAVRAELGFGAAAGGWGGDVFVAVAPLSGRTLRWRSDGFYQSDDTNNVVTDDWDSWGYSLDGYESQYETPPGDSSAPTWWMCTGEARPGAQITAWLADNRDVTVIQLGGLWLVEYLSTPTTVFIDIDGQLIEDRPWRPAYLRPARFPYPSHAPNPRAY